MSIQVVVWNEYLHEHEMPEVAKIYPDGIHNCIAHFLKEDDTFSVSTAVLRDVEHGLTLERLEKTDVLIWWGHMAHDQVSDEVVKRVQKRVLEGMGLIVLHSGHFSKIFKTLMGTGCGLSWRVADEREVLWTVNPSHPIANGIPGHHIIDKEEMYGEPFAVPEPDETVFMGWFEGGNVFRSGLVYKRGSGKIFYFQPGHETYPIYHDEVVQRIISNGVKYVYSQNKRESGEDAPNSKPVIEIRS